MTDDTLNKLSSLFGEAVSKYFTKDKLLFLLMDEKIKSFGIRLTRTQRKKLILQLQVSDSKSIHIELNRQQKTQLKKLGLDDLKLEINGSDFGALESKVTEVIEHVGESAVENIINSVSEKLVKDWKKQSKSILRELRIERRNFNSYNNKIWGNALSLLEMLIDISLDTGAEFNQKFRPLAFQENDFVFEALTRLHARSCQVGSEILILLQHGFADGAHARWRTLHEISVVARFVAHHDNDLAERYLVHSIVADYQRAVEYRKHSEKLSYAPIPGDVFDEIKSNYEAAIAKYGSGFKNDYGWASTILNKDRPSFTDIEEKAGISYMRPFVKLAHMNIHAGSKGIIFRLGSPPAGPNLIVAGSSIYGVGEPAQNTAYSIDLAIETLLLSKSSFDNLGFVLAFRKLMREVIWEFDRVMTKQENRNNSEKKENNS